MSYLSHSSMGVGSVGFEEAESRSKNHNLGPIARLDDITNVLKRNDEHIRDERDVLSLYSLYTAWHLLVSVHGLPFCFRNFINKIESPDELVQRIQNLFELGLNLPPIPISS